VKSDSGAEVASVVCAGLEICDWAGGTRGGTGASMAGAIACAPTVAACAVFSWFACCDAEPTRFRFAVSGRSVAVASVLSVDVVWVPRFCTAFHGERPVSDQTSF
jgi:hypothetical protein